jgi:hypothetical protein
VLAQDGTFIRIESGDTAILDPLKAVFALDVM